METIYSVAGSKSYKNLLADPRNYDAITVPIYPQNSEIKAGTLITRNSAGLWTPIASGSIATDKEWESVYAALAFYGYELYDMPSSNGVWGKYLSDVGFKQHVVTATCPDCYTIRDFCRDHPSGTYVIGTGSHAVAAINGDYYDTWDSGDEIVSYYWGK